jgi:hypothetical protein
MKLTQEIIAQAAAFVQHDDSNQSAHVKQRKALEDSIIIYRLYSLSRPETLKIN